MKHLYSSPLRVYLCLGILALAGVVSGLKLPISLFPNSSKPEVRVEIPYGGFSPDEFFNSYGRKLEEQFRAVSTDQLEVEIVESYYNRDQAEFDIGFKWGTSPQSALKEIRLVANSFASRLSDEMRDGLRVSINNENSGFFAASFYSPIRTLDEIFNILDPVFTPALSKIQDMEFGVLWNPTSKEVSIELDPNKMAALQLLPKDVAHALGASLISQNGGSVTVGTQWLSIQMPRKVNRLEDFSEIPISAGSGKGASVHLSDFAKIDFGIKTTHSRSFKTSGSPSLILYAIPKPGGNVKKMSEDLIQLTYDKLKPLSLKDLEHKILVDPSEFIRSAISNVIKEVALGAFLAVCILFFFIGSFKNTVTAAIEIPLSMVLAFILMKWSGMNLNLISFGGLALSSGMNVDASVVVMENIFRRFTEASASQPRMGMARKLEILLGAVHEVRFAVVASTIASLVVFIPLAFTSDLTFAILGDLALTRMPSYQNS